MNGLHEMVKKTIKEHKQKIELTQWAITSGIASLVYSEYLKNMKQKQTPVKRIFLPPIKSVSRLLDRDGTFMDFLSEHLINQMVDSPLYRKYSNAPELELFKIEKIEVLKTIFDLYMVPNISSRLPETIMKKFRLDDPNQQLMVESNDLLLFEDKAPIDDPTFEYLVEECLLQLLTMIPTMKKDIEIPESNLKLYLSGSEILTIGNDNAICPIHINKNIIERCDHVCDLLKFVTGTEIRKMEYNENARAKAHENGDDEIVDYEITTSPFNQVIITHFNGIEVTAE
ncbi:MAG: hypothetical protein NC548_28370 [Lachnospiraceae bacterium]|nr:hypothetical protein [Lachnospiraceae bacterium]MCM1232005.1 hypothetical protein [Ruminococcus flavefaciens]